MISNLLSLTERKLERVRIANSEVMRHINALKEKQDDVSARIQTLLLQVLELEHSGCLTRDAFFDRQRLKAAVLSDVAQHSYQYERLNTEIAARTQEKQQLQRKFSEFYRRREKFQIYQARLLRERRLKLNISQQSQIEELLNGRF